MSSRTAVILARGLGTRMRQADTSVSLTAEQASSAEAGVKGMIAVGRPFIEYLLSALADAGVRNVVLVIGPEHRHVREYFTNIAPPSRVHVTFAEQAQPLGTADAVVAASLVVRESSFLVLNADNYYPVAAYAALLRVSGAAVVAFDRDALAHDGNIPLERVRSFALLDVDVHDRLVAIIEKPCATTNLAAPSARWVGMNLWRVTPALVDACRRVPLSSRGEFELPEAVALAISEGIPVHAVRMSAGVLDLSRRSDIAAVAKRLAGVVAST